MSLSRILKSAGVAAGIALAADPLEAQQLERVCYLRPVADSVRVEQLSRQTGGTIQLSQQRLPQQPQPQYPCPGTPVKPAPKAAPAPKKPVQPADPIPEYTMRLTVNGKKDTSLVINQHDKPVIPLHIGDTIYFTGEGPRLKNCRVAGRDATTQEFLKGYITGADTAVVWGVETSKDPVDAKIRLQCDYTSPRGVTSTRTPRDRNAYFYTVPDTVVKQDTTPREQPPVDSQPTPVKPKKPRAPFVVPVSFSDIYGSAGHLSQSQNATNQAGVTTPSSMNAPYIMGGISRLGTKLSFQAEGTLYNSEGREVSPTHMTTDMNTRNSEFNAFVAPGLTIKGYTLIAAGELGQRKLQTSERFTLDIPGEPLTTASSDVNITATYAGVGAGINVPFKYGRALLTGMASRQTDNSRRQGADAMNGFVMRGMVRGVVATPWLNGKPLQWGLDARLSDYTGGIVQGTGNEFTQRTIDVKGSYPILPVLDFNLGAQYQTTHDVEFKTAKTFKIGLGGRF